MLERIHRPRFTPISVPIALLSTLLLAMLLVLVPVSAIASAHDQLIESSPSDGQELESAPTEATLRFSAEMIEIGAEIALIDAESSESIALPEAFTIDYDTLSQPLPELGAGSYAINWRVVSQDGHPISGTIGFTVVGGSALDTEPTAQPTETAGLGNASDEVPSTAEESSQDSVEPQDTGSGTALLTEPWQVIALTIVAVLVGAGAILTFVMRMRRGNQPGK